MVFNHITDIGGLGKTDALRLRTGGFVIHCVLTDTTIAGSDETRHR